MENEPAAPDSTKPTPPAAPARDPLIRYSVFAALGCAGLCMVFTILYIFSYSLDSTLSFERHFDAYLSSANAANMPTILGLHMAQNRIFLQSCGMVAGIFFAFLGVALFLVGIQGTVDATGEVRDYSTNFRRLAPGGIILLASMVFVGASAIHPVDFTLGPTPTAPAISITPAEAPAAQPSTTSTAPATQSQLQLNPQPAAHLAPQSAQVPANPPANQPPAQTTPAAAPARRPSTRLALVNQKTTTPPPPAEHRFQP